MGSRSESERESKALMNVTDPKKKEGLDQMSRTDEEEAEKK
jgi:hypothetical protein